MKKIRICILLTISGSLIWVAGCKKSPTEPEPEPDPEPASITIVSGQDQSAPGGTLLNEPLVIKVNDETGSGLAGVNVSWSVKMGNGTVSPASGETNNNGIAQAEWTLGMARDNVVSAHVSGLDSLEFRATGISSCEEPGQPVPGNSVASGLPQYGEAVHLGDLFSGNTNAAVLDIGGDGDEDVVVFAGDHAPPVGGGSVFIMRNDGTGTFTKDSTDISFDEVAVGRAVTVFDVDGDGLTDVYFGQSREEEGYSNGFKNLVLIQQGGTLVNMAQTLLDPNSEEFSHAVISADIDCDGDVDAFDVSEGNVRVNDGTGVLENENERLAGRPSEPGVGTPTWAAFGDYDRDGDQDLFELEGDGWAVLYDNDGFGWFTAAPSSSIPDPATSLAGYGAADETWFRDVDLDGWPDLLISAGPDEIESGGTPTGKVFLWQNNGDGTFSDVTDERIPQNKEGTPYRMFVEDINGDKWPDILYSSGTVEACTIFTNDGDGYFTGHRMGQTDVCGWYFPLEANGDGKTDLFILAGSGMSFALNEN